MEKSRCKTGSVKIRHESIKCSHHKVVFCTVGGPGGLGGFEEAGYGQRVSFPLIAVFNPPDSIKRKRNLGCPVTRLQEASQAPSTSREKAGRHESPGNQTEGTPVTN